jgi:alpha-ketoglutarate-dependent taurine dioxygenase
MTIIEESTTTSLDIRRSGPAIGATVHGVDLDAGLTAAEAETLTAALHEHALLVFPGQNLSFDSALQLAASFGDVAPASAVIRGISDDYPQIRVVDGALSNGRVSHWHSDITYMSNPPKAVLLWAHVSPEFGGDTQFASLDAAYDSLSQPIRDVIDELVAVHQAPASIHEALAEYGSGVWDGEIVDRLDPVRHPVVRVHQVTGRRGLYVNPRFTSHIEGLRRHESEGLLDLLYQHIVRPEHVLRVRWAAGDVVLFDNRSVVHYAIDDYGGSERVMYHVNIAGSGRLAGVRGTIA